MLNRQEMLDTLDSIIEQADTEPLKRQLKAVAHKIRFPMHDILAKVPGDTLSARARRIGVSRQTMYVWASERSRPTTAQAEVISKLTGVPVVHIVDDGFETKDPKTIQEEPELQSAPIQSMLATLDPFFRIRGTMPARAIQAFLLVAGQEELPVGEYVKRAGVPITTMSRNLIDLSERDRNYEEGAGLVEGRDNPMNRREKLYRLTPRGRELLASVTGAEASIDHTCQAPALLHAAASG
jgi:DNA-binding MarR family transcriptional regulator/DNA-binding XRE family transcriptional regulator